MLKCRYYDNCYFMECDIPDKCDGYGNCESDRWGKTIRTKCREYEPMPDVEALKKLADEIDVPDTESDFGYIDALIRKQQRSYARRIRQAIGEEES